MLSKNTLKYLNALHLKKYRQQHGAFLVEGQKSVLELLAAHFDIELLVVSELFYKENKPVLDKQPFRLEIATPAELARAGTLQTNDAALAVVRTKPNDFLCADANEYVLVLDDVRDPGNLGTIIRIADWYGITKIICSDSTTDWYNPKVVAASKGSFLRVRGYYCDLPVYLEQQRAQPIYGTFMKGQDIHQVAFGGGGYVVMGNESNGIGQAVEKLINNKITIPRFGGAESLNVAIAAAIVCDNLRRMGGVSSKKHEAENE
ncbi:MAG: RNA methyltransferase [Cytophagia bacterium]|jgi:RNA methyltransferase, TrmH family|nr:MAG: RNA methyltransferase [Runella sp.]TAG16301.1 MAG: RNA methyltransferase [Cytophagales bacterium]TAG35564.1 MAG: RNA methyltransferase [Cytophagia bacterium]TAG54667.1 MAG: RNA methyltransferase [Runella slithyformis]TAG59741.1 MAG: RNA methyltransferase [Runella slithyformis]